MAVNQCRWCGVEFASRNQVFKHVRAAVQSLVSALLVPLRAKPCRPRGVPRPSLQ